MFPLLVVLFLLLPLAELWVIVSVAGGIGIGSTIVLLLTISFAGAWLVKHPGLRGAAPGPADVDRGAIPTTELVDGALIVLAGALLLTPGFITDTVGFLLLIPPSRAVVRKVADHPGSSPGVHLVGAVPGPDRRSPAVTSSTSTAASPGAASVRRPAPARAVTAAVRPAATVMLVRDTRRGTASRFCCCVDTLTSVFVAGAHVFPGGAVDPATLAGDDVGGRRPRRRHRVRAASVSPPAVSPTGWPPCGRPSRRPACCWRRPCRGWRPLARPGTGGPAARGPSRGRRRPPVRWPSCAGPRACISISAPCARSAGGSPRSAHLVATTPGSSWPRPRPVPEVRVDRPRGRGRRVARAGRRARAFRPGRDRSHPAHRAQPGASWPSTIDGRRCWPGSTPSPTEIDDHGGRRVASPTDDAGPSSRRAAPGGPAARR